MHHTKDSQISALLLNFYYKKQENQAAILMRFSVDVANKRFRLWFAAFSQFNLIRYILSRLQLIRDNTKYMGEICIK